MKREGGYTIVETGLAVAVSAALVLLTIGLASMVGRRRFQDSLTTAQSFIQMQYNEVRAGINSRLNQDSGHDGFGSWVNLQGLNCGDNVSAGNSENCYVVGRLLTFGNDGGNGFVKSSYVIAVQNTDIEWPDIEKTAIDNLNDIRLVAITSETGDGGLNPTTKTLNGNTISSAWSIMSTDSGVEVGPSSGSEGRVENTNLALLRSPIDGSLIVASNVETGLEPSGFTSVNLKNNDPQGSRVNMTINDKIVLGITNGGLGQQGGLICIAGGDNSASVSNNNNVNLNDYVNNVAGWQNRLKEACKNWE